MSTDDLKATLTELLPGLRRDSQRTALPVNVNVTEAPEVDVWRIPPPLSVDTLSVNKELLMFTEFDETAR